NCSNDDPTPGSTITLGPVGVDAHAPSIGERSRSPTQRVRMPLVTSGLAGQLEAGAGILLGGSGRGLRISENRRRVIFAAVLDHVLSASHVGGRLGDSGPGFTSDRLPALAASEKGDDLVEGQPLLLGEAIRDQELPPVEPGLLTLLLERIAGNAELARQMPDDDASAIGFGGYALDG